jgi:hypothetical protein
VVEYVIDPAKIEAFERFGRRWIELVDSQYRALVGSDPDFIEADRIRDQSGCVLRYERTFMRPLLPGHPAG